MWRLVALYDLLSGEFISMIGYRFLKKYISNDFLHENLFFSDGFTKQSNFLTILVCNEV